LGLNNGNNNYNFLELLFNSWKYIYYNL